MHADAHFVIGLAHVNGGKPCQDYAASGELPGGGAFAIVADGCSSGGKTDVGARVLALATEQELRSTTAMSADALRGAMKSRQRTSFQLSQQLFGLEQPDLLATCGFIVHRPEITLVHVQGDGVVAEMFPDGTLSMIRFDWLGNAPSYPAYMLGGYEDFIRFHGGLESVALAATYHATGAGAPEDATGTWTVADALEGRYWQPNPYATRLAVFTDGVTQIDGVDWTEAVTELMSFKSLAGEFAKRRLNRLVRDWHKAGRGPIDDLAYAVIELDP